jgi:hypothetical protein
MGGGIVRVDSDDIELGKILEVDGFEAVKLAAENQMQELLARHVGHDDGTLLTRVVRIEACVEPAPFRLSWLQ